jgi:hypothetical protein
MRTALRTVVAVIVRAAAFVAGEWAFTRVYEANVPATPGDADIGEGLLAFLLMMVAALLWAAWDGYRRDFGPAAATWIATGALTGGVLAVGIGFGEEGSSLSLMLADLVDNGPFLAGLVVVPALIGAAFTAIIHRSVRPTFR